MRCVTSWYSPHWICLDDDFVNENFDEHCCGPEPAFSLSFSGEDGRGVMPDTGKILKNKA